MNTTVLLLLPLIGAFLGWLAVQVLVSLIFRPSTLAKKQRLLAAGLGRKAAEILDIPQMAAQSKDPALIASLMPGIEKHIDGFLQQRLKEKIPVLAMFLSDSVLQTIRTSLLDEIEALLPQVVGQFADKLGARLDVQKIVTDKLSAMPPAQLGNMIRSALERELRLLGIAGALLGLVIGLVHLCLSALLQAN